MITQVEADRNDSDICVIVMISLIDSVLESIDEWRKEAMDL